MFSNRFVGYSIDTRMKPRIAVNAPNNAAMERLFGLLRKNVLHPQFWATREEQRIAIVTWIERTYHRRQASLGKLTPIEFETIMTTPANQAA